MKRALLILFLIILFSGSLYLFYLNRPKGKVFSSATNLPFDLEATNLIVFVSDRDGNSEIYLTDERGSFLKRVTNTPQKEFSPDFSPATHKIAYLSENLDYTGIWLFSLDNQTKRLLNISRDKPRLLKYSPDGQFLALQEDGLKIKENGDLFVIRTQDGKIERVASNVNNFSWSSDSRTVVYSERNPNNSIFEAKIKVRNINGEELLTPEGELAGGGMAPVFLSANKILFLDVTGEFLKLVSISLRGENKEELFNLGIAPQEKANYYLSVNPAEDKIIFQISLDQVLFEPLIIALKQKTLEKFSLEAKSLKWGEKGEIIFAAEDDKGNLELWLKEPSVLNVSQLTTEGNNWL